MTKLYPGSVLHTRTNQHVSLSTNVLRRKTNHNSFKIIIINKGATDEAEYEESSGTVEVLRYFNIFECRRNFLNRLDVTYERVIMATPKDKNFEKMLENLVEHTDRHNAPLSNEKL